MKSCLSELNGQCVKRTIRKAPHKRIIPDMDNSESPLHGEQEGSSYNGHFGCTCCHPSFCFNRFGDCEGAMPPLPNRKFTNTWRIKQGKYALNWPRLSCKRFVSNQVRPALFVLIKIGAKFVRSGRYTAFQMAEVVVSRNVFAEMLSLISRLRCCTT